MPRVFRRVLTHLFATIALDDRICERRVFLRGKREQHVACLQVKTMARAAAPDIEARACAGVFVSHRNRCHLSFFFLLKELGCKFYSHLNQQGNIEA